MNISVSTDKPNPIQLLWPTPMWLGYLDIDKEKLIDLAEWARLQGWENVGDTPVFTTHNGEQYLIPRGLPDADGPAGIQTWETAPGVKEFWPQIIKALNEFLVALTGQTCYEATPNGSQFVFYREGGHQWPHWHKATWTAILGLRGRGTLLIQDPRPLATTQTALLKEIIINPGQLIITPGYLVHSSHPTQTERDILVIVGD